MDDRKCDLRECGCAKFDWDKEECPHFHMSCPPIVRSKQDKLGTTRQAFDKRRDRMMREAEKRIERKAGPGGGDPVLESKLYDIRRNPVKHLRKKGIRI